jgi:hypothetical protein
VVIILECIPNSVLMRLTASKWILILNTMLISVINKVLYCDAQLHLLALSY